MASADGLSILSTWRNVICPFVDVGVKIVACLLGNFGVFVLVWIMHKSARPGCLNASDALDHGRASWV